MLFREGLDNAATQLNVVNSRFASSAQFSTLRGALIFMASKGTNFRGDETPDYYTSEFDPPTQLHTISYYSDMPSCSTPVKGTILQSLGQTNPAVSKSPSPTKSRVPTGSQNRQASNLQSSGQTSLVVLRTPSPTKSKVPTGSPKRQASNLTNIQTNFRNISLGSSTFAGSSSSDVFFYQHIRSLSEVINTVRAPVFPAVEYLISFGGVVDSYLRSHGYNQEAIMALEQAWVSSRGRRPEFIRDICLEGLLQAEADSNTACTMSTPLTTIEAPKRYRNLTRHLVADISHRRPYRLQKKRQTQKKTAAAKAEAKARRDARQEEYTAALQGVAECVESEAIKLREQFGGHTLDYYKAEILQLGGLKGRLRGVSRWNAFLRYEAKLANERKHTSTMAELKTKLKNIINSSLEALLGKVRMIYIGFDEKFTASYGVVIENWPIERFIAPSELTCPELDILLGAWTSGTTFFRKMETDEWEKWRKNYMPVSSSSSINSSTLSECAAASSNDTMAVDIPTTTSNSQQAPNPMNDITDATNNVSSLQFIHSSGSGTLSNGVRKHKQRSDAGKKRGSHKKDSLVVTVPSS
ncbi:hypothetical protein C0992_007384 [Termitomyces sp. T32_za158]|nr:hypothetical protein C0992_007384 [Termitomyces sp. T32_za158]